MATKETTDDGSPEDGVAIPPKYLDSVSESSVSLTTGKENTLNTGERESKYVLDHEGHHMYLRLWRALLYLKEALHEPVLSEVNKVHNKLKEKLDEKKITDDEKKKNFLNSYLKSNYFKKSDESSKIYINNLNIEKWEGQPWETAKAFMQSGQKEKNNGPKDTDSMGILRLISSCKQFDDWLKFNAGDMSGHEKVSEVLNIRHSVGHSGSLCCTETEMKEGFEEIKILMEHMKQRFKSFADNENVLDSDKIIYQAAEKKMVDALHSVEKVKTDTDFDVMRKLVADDIRKSRAYGSANVTQRQFLVKVQSRYATRKIFIVLNDLYKERREVLIEYLLKEKILESFIIEANPDVMFLLAALEEKQMFQAEKLDDLLRLVEPSPVSDRLQPIKTSLDIYKRTLKRTSDIESGTVYDVFILHCEADTEKSYSFRKSHLDILQDLNPPAKMILYDEYVVSGTGHLSALDYVFKDCRLVFILCTQAFMKDALSMFQAEMLMYDSMGKESPRVIPVNLTQEDYKSLPKWLKAIASIDVWKQFASNHLMSTLKDGRKKFLKSSQ